MIVDRDGNLWVGSVGQGLFRIRGDRVEHYGRADGLSNDNVDALFEDKEGILWIATPSGIDSFRDPPVTTFSSLEGLGMDVAMGVLVAGMARSGSRMGIRSIRSPAEQPRRFARGMACRVNSQPPCSKIPMAIFGWEWMTTSAC